MTTPPLGKTAKELIPSHLLETSTKDLRESSLKATTETPPVDTSARDAMRDEVYPFQFRYVDGNGREYAGSFIHKVLDMGTRMAVGHLRATLMGGVPYAATDPYTRELNLIIADLEFSLQEQPRPAWAKDLRTIRDHDVLYKLWEVASDHEATFCGRPLPARAGSTEE